MSIIRWSKSFPYSLQDLSSDVMFSLFFYSVMGVIKNLVHIHKNYLISITHVFKKYLLSTSGSDSGI